jgi:hypothetical protein
MSGFLGAVTTTIPTFPSGVNPAPFVQGGSSGVVGQNGGSSTLVSQSDFGLSTFLGLFLDVAAVIVVLALVGVFVIIVVANRADPDPSGRRPQSVYYFAVSFVTLSVAIFASAFVASGIVLLVGNHPSSTTNAAARMIVLGGLGTLVGTVLLVMHLRRGVSLARADDKSPNPSRRVGQSYVSAVAFVSVLSIFVLWVLSAYLLFSLAGPGVFGSFGSRTDTVRVLIVVIYLWVIAGVVLLTHRTLITPELDLFGYRSNRDRPTSGHSPDVAVPPA